MAVKSIERAFGDSVAEGSPYALDWYDAEDLKGLDAESEDDGTAIWPRGEMEGDDLPPAPGGFRRVPHDW